ncbi:MAG: PASTA domain-containing protein [Nitrospirae bacterium]|nr:PASTA domain-containing protein [Nitrospirota bacterium]
MKNFLKLLMYFVIFTVVGAGGAYLVFEKIGFGKTGVVPSLTGKSVSEATEMLNKRKLSLAIKGQSYDDNVPGGHIIRQLAEPGTKAAPGAEVDVIVSKGKGQEMFSLPSFEGQLLDEAKLTLANLEMKAGKVTWTHSDTVEKGTIIAQRPLPGNIKVNEINFLVSLGPYDVFYKCPSFVNMTVDDAKMLAQQLGIELVEQEEGGKVVAQRPAAGEIIRKGDAVEVTLGSGRPSWF